MIERKVGTKAKLMMVPLVTVCTVSPAGAVTNVKLIVTGKGVGVGVGVAGVGVGVGLAPDCAAFKATKSTPMSLTSVPALW